MLAVLRILFFVVLLRGSFAVGGTFVPDEGELAASVIDADQLSDLRKFERTVGAPQLTKPCFFQPRFELRGIRKSFHESVRYFVEVDMLVTPALYFLHPRG